MICPNCGSAIPEGSAFCPVCSNAVGSSWPGGPQQGGFTPQQPHQNAGGQYLTGQGPGGPGQFGHGGYDLNFDYPRQGSGMPGQFGPGQTYGMPPYGGQPPKKGKGPLIAAIVGGVAAVVAIVLVVVFLVIPALTGGGSADEGRNEEISEPKDNESDSSSIGGGLGSADRVAREIGDLEEECWSSDLSSSDAADYANGVDELMAPGAFDLFLSDLGTSRADFENNLMVSGQQIMDASTPTIDDFEVGSSFDDDDLDEANDQLGSLGYSVDDGCVLIPLSNGRRMVSSGVEYCAVEIDGSWYLWFRMTV